MEPCAVKAQGLGRGPILVVLAHPDEAPATLRVARFLGRALGKHLVLGLISYPPPSPEGVLGRLGLAGEEARDMAVHVLDGAPEHAAVSLAEDLDCAMIAIAIPATAGTHDASMISHVLTSASCPVLAVPVWLDARWGTTHRVLVPLDGTPGTAAATSLAADVATRLEAKLEYLHVAALPSTEPGAMAVPAYVDQPQYEWPAWRHEFLARFAQPGIDEARLTVVAGPPGAGILRAADREGADLLVVGWHGCLSGGHAATLRAVLASTRWPVLATRLFRLPANRSGQAGTRPAGIESGDGR